MRIIGHEVLLEGRLFGLLMRESHFLVGRVCLAPVNTASCPVCGCPMVCD